LQQLKIILTEYEKAVTFLPVKAKQRKPKIPQGKRAIWLCLPEELIQSLDERLDKQTGDLRPVFRSRPEVFAAALQSFLETYASSSVPGSRRLATN